MQVEPGVRWWERLFDLRRQVCPEPDIDSWDSALQHIECAAGHETLTFNAFPGGLPSVDSVRDRATAGVEEACATCGAPRRTTRLEFGSWLPAAEVDALIAIQAGDVTEIVLVGRDVVGTVVDRAHPTLGEMAAACATRSVRSSWDDPAAAVREAAEILRRYPDYVPSIKTAARSAKAAGQPDEARRHVDRLLALCPNDAEAHFLLGDLLDETDDLDGALQAYDASLALNPGRAQTHIQQAVVLKRLGRLDEGYEAYERALELAPHHTIALYNQAILLREAGREEEIVFSLEQVRPSSLGDQDRFRQAFFDMASDQAVKRAGDNEWLRAARAFSLATLFDDSNPQVWSNLAVCYRNLGAWSEAVPALRRVLALDATYQDAAERLAYASQRASEDGSSTLGIRIRHTIEYDDAQGRPRRLLNYIVKIATTTTLLESDPSTLSLDREKDLFKLLVAKGRNLRVAQGKAGRPIVFAITTPPSDEFLQLAAATSWRTPDGKLVASAPVEIQLGDENITPKSEGPVDLPRVPVLETTDEGDLFYPAEYADYD